MSRKAKEEAPAVERPAFEVTVHQYVELVIPKGEYGAFGHYDFRRTFDRGEAQELAQALASAALEIPA